MIHDRIAFFSKTTLAPALLITFGAASVAATLPAGVQLAAKQEMLRNNGSEPDTLGPARAESVPANNVICELFEGLTASDSTGKIVSGVAESWKQTDATSWVFKLRQNAKWSQGDAVSADDFVYALRRFVDPKTASEYASSFGVFLVNGKEIAAGKMPPSELGVKALDKTTLEKFGKD